MSECLRDQLQGLAEDMLGFESKNPDGETDSDVYLCGRDDCECLLKIRIRVRMGIVAEAVVLAAGGKANCAQNS
jgi:hypothetical protein